MIFFTYFFRLRHTLHQGDGIVFQVHVIKWKPLLKSVAISLGVGILSGLLTMGGRETYQSITQSALSPPSVVFPIVWTILYILMGISAYIIAQSNSPSKKAALTIYAAQLIVNFFWSIIFFNAQAYLFAFIWLILLWVLIVAMMMSFYTIDRCAALLQIPYLLWVTFAGYLNWQIYILN
jgi:tryptophan-rich sensory protein